MPHKPLFPIRISSILLISATSCIRSPGKDSAGAIAPRRGKVQLISCFSCRHEGKSLSLNFSSLLPSQTPLLHRSSSSYFPLSSKPFLTFFLQSPHHCLLEVEVHWRCVDSCLAPLPELLPGIFQKLRFSKKLPARIKAVEPMASYVLEAKSVSNLRKRSDKFLKAKATGNSNRMMHMQSSSQEVSQQLFARKGRLCQGKEHFVTAWFLMGLLLVAV